jgi:hypothetical protein
MSMDMDLQTQPLDLLQPCKKGTRLYSWENYYIEEYQAKGQLFEE